MASRQFAAGPLVRRAHDKPLCEFVLSGLVSRAGCGYLVRRADMADHAPRRGGRVVECTALEMRHTRKGIGGSNPPLSATFERKPNKFNYLLHDAAFGPPYNPP